MPDLRPVAESVGLPATMEAAVRTENHMTTHAGVSPDTPRHPQLRAASGGGADPPLDHHQEELLAALAKLAQRGRLPGDIAPGVGEANA